MIDWYKPIETTDGRLVHPKPPYWPNPVSLEYCGVIYDAEGNSDEHWWTDEGQPLNGAPAIRNVKTNKVTPRAMEMIRERFHSDITPGERGFLIELQAELLRRR